MTPNDDKLRAIHEAIRAGWTGPPNFLELDLPAWYGHVLSDLLLLIDDDDITHTDGTADSATAEEPHSAQILVFTNQLVIAVDATMSEERKRTTTAYSRSDLTALTVRASRSALQDHFGSDGWPGQVHVKLAYDDERTYSLPLSGHSDYRKTERLVGFLPSLRRDLIA